MFVMKILKVSIGLSNGVCKFLRLIKNMLFSIVAKFVVNSKKQGASSTCLYIVSPHFVTKDLLDVFFYLIAKLNVENHTKNP